MAKIYDALYKTTFNETIIKLNNFTPKDYLEKYCTIFWKAKFWPRRKSIR